MSPHGLVEKFWQDVTEQTEHCLLDTLWGRKINSRKFVDDDKRFEITVQDHDIVYVREPEKTDPPWSSCE